MCRTQKLLFAALLMSSATAFAADTPDPSKGEEMLPPDSFEGVPPSTPPPAAQLPPEGQSLPADAAPATSPGEENKGKPAVSPDTAAQPKAEGSNTSVPATSPGEENKGKPQVAPQ
jgi:hypothetical protein